jgi:hypothetical protein
MKEQFIGFYELTSGEIDRIWEKGIFVFDANSLLNLYRYSSETSKDFLQILNKIKDQIFLPHQVGYEFHSNRHLVIQSINNSYDALISDTTKAVTDSFDQIVNNYSKHPVIQVKKLKELKDKFLIEFKEELSKQNKLHVDYSLEDTFLDQITSLFEGKVGAEFSDSELEDIYNEGALRYNKNIPPGYKDSGKKNKGDRHLYGDLIIWKQLINFSKETHQSIIFITDDRKEDWWQLEQGKTIRPRQELISEFYKETGIRILIYSTDRFMQYAKKKKLVLDIKQKSITEIKDIRINDVAYLALNEMLNKQNIENIGYPALFNVKENLYSIDGKIFNSTSQLASAQIPSGNNHIYSGESSYSNLLKTHSSALDMLYNNDFITSTPASIRISTGNIGTLDLLKPVIQPLKLSALVNKESKED